VWGRLPGQEEANFGNKLSKRDKRTDWTKALCHFVKLNVAKKKKIIIIVRGSMRKKDPCLELQDCPAGWVSALSSLTSVLSLHLSPSQFSYQLSSVFSCLP
jgi:hypothetical protein